jgi:hypothetical protein
MLAPPHRLHLLLMRLCSQMLEPPHGLHTLPKRLCWQLLPHIRFLAIFLKGIFGSVDFKHLPKAIAGGSSKREGFTDT